MDKQISSSLPPLPDEIVCHILSFLPTKLAFATVVLSKWLTSLLHSSTSDLRFYYDGGDKVTFRRFLRFVDTVMLFPREQHHPIKNLVLYLNSTGSDEAFTFHEWVEVAKRHPIESLDIYTAGCATVSPSIFSSRTLVVLKLTSIGMVGNVLSVDLPSLKTLHLSQVMFQKRDDFKKLLYGAPILQDLYLAFVNSEIPYTTGSKILPKLVKLHLDTWADPLSALELAQRECDNINMYIPPPVFPNLFLVEKPVFPNLIHIEIYCQRFDGWNRVLQMLRQCPRLQHLVIRKANVKTGIYKKKLTYSECVPECVSSHLRTCFIGSLVNYEDDLRFVEYVMKNAKFLQALTVCPCRLRPNQQSYVLEDILSLQRVSPACKFSLLNCSLHECSCGFNNATECRRRHKPYCWQTKESFLYPRKFHSLN
ncbi:FBD-associated F-box protein At5g38590-like [Lotus japonicus]|uniref:FBD-associated F-box protein At5g38590-like n=1 Tax=Lotus japonicus TaxID=34305 RepID=UPI0025836B78|nr:FBD-associated F-box protein At5g38590-like [Lotus japonicus]